MTSDNTQLTDEDLLNQCVDNFYFTASIQGRVAYFLMSIYAVNPNVWHRFIEYSPSHILFSNMIYGSAVYIFSRPAMRPISIVNRVIFSILGSMMFNYSSMLVFDYLVRKWSHRPFLVTILGFFSGRIMMLHYLSYLYHVDRMSRIERNFQRNAAFDSIINQRQQKRIFERLIGKVLQRYYDNFTSNVFSSVILDSKIKRT